MITEQEYLRAKCIVDKYLVQSNFNENTRVISCNISARLLNVLACMFWCKKERETFSPKLYWEAFNDVTLGDLKTIDIEEIAKQRNVGKKTLEEFEYLRKKISNV